MDSSDNIYVTGTTRAGLDGNSFSGGYGDIILVKFYDNGTKQWTQQLGTSNTDQGFEVAMAGRFGECRWSYFDTVHLVGSYTEIYWLPPDMAPVFEKMKRGEDPFA